MPIPITDKFKPAGVGGFSLIDAEDVEMPDGSRLSDFKVETETVEVCPKVVQGVSGQELEPETYYVFGEVSKLAVTLVDKDDDLAHEYMFEFIPAEGFTEPTITPIVTWLCAPQFPVGKRCIISVVMGVAVMGCG